MIRNLLWLQTVDIFWNSVSWNVGQICAVNRADKGGLIVFVAPIDKAVQVVEPQEFFSLFLYNSY